MSKVIAIFACLTFIILAFISPSAFVTNAQNGMILFGRNVLPILFPFFFISGLLIELDLFKNKSIQKIGLVSLSYLAGFPTSARMLSQLYTRGEISREEAIRTATYTSTASPIFIIATVGTSLYGTYAGILIFISHIAGALLNGLLYRRYRSAASSDKLIRECATKDGKAQYRFGALRLADSQINLSSRRDTAIAGAPSVLFEERGHPAGARGVQSRPRSRSDEKKILRQPATSNINISDAVTRALNSAVQNILAVGGLIIIFFIASAPFPWPIAGLLEMTTGVFRAYFFKGGFLTTIFRAVIPCAIVSFGGLCVAMQGFVFLKTFKMPVRFYFLYKFTHALFAVIICFILTIMPLMFVVH